MRKATHQIHNDDDQTADFEAYSGRIDWDAVSDGSTYTAEQGAEFGPHESGLFTDLLDKVASERGQSVRYEVEDREVHFRFGAPKSEKSGVSESDDSTDEEPSPSVKRTPRNVLTK